MVAGLAAAAASIPLALAALAVARAFARATVRYRLYGFGFAAVAALAPLAFGLALLRPAPAGTASSAGAGTFAFPALAGAAAVAVALLGALCADIVRVLRVKRAAERIGSLPVRRARLGVSTAVSTPTAIGYLHPAVVVPGSFRERVDAAEWEAVLAHECAHLARRDDWGKALQSAALRIGWWLPGLWLLGPALDLERELASDERAAAAGGARRYAACLLRLASARTPDVAPALWGRRTHLAIRVERLLHPVAPGGGLTRAVAFGVFTALTLALCALVTAVVPAWGPVARAGAPQLRLHASAPAAARHVVRVAMLEQRPKPAAAALIHHVAVADPAPVRRAQHRIVCPPKARTVVHRPPHHRAERWTAADLQPPPVALRRPALSPNTSPDDVPSAGGQVAQAPAPSPAGALTGGRPGTVLLWFRLPDLPLPH